MDHGDRGGVPPESEKAECHGHAPRPDYGSADASVLLSDGDTGRPDRGAVEVY